MGSIKNIKMSVKPFSYMKNDDDFPSFRVKTTYYRGKNDKGLREKEVRIFNLDNSNYMKPYDLICKPYENLMKRISERYHDLLPKVPDNASFEQHRYNYYRLMEDVHLLLIDETGDKVLITDDEDLSSSLLHIKETAEKNKLSEYPVVNFVIEKITNRPKEEDEE